MTVGRLAREAPALVSHVNEVIATDGARTSVITWYEVERGLRKLELEGQGGTALVHDLRLLTSDAQLVQHATAGRPRLT